MLSHGKKHNGYQVAKRVKAEDADSGYAVQAGLTTYKSQYCSDLLNVPSVRLTVSHIEKDVNRGNRHLS